MHAERRHAERKAAFVAVEIDGEKRKGRVGMTRDASRTGVLVATPSRFEVGDALRLTLFVGVHERATVSGKVIRVETTNVRSNELWRYRLAVAFDAALDEAPAFAPPSRATA